MAYTTTQLLAAIERRSFAPANQQTFSPEEILQMADEELQTALMPSIYGVYEEYFIHQQTYPILESKYRYPLPDRSVGMAARDVRIKNSSGGYRDLPRIDPGEVTTTNTGRPDAFYMQNYDVCLFRRPSSSNDSLVVDFAMLPGHMVQPQYGAEVSSINRGTGEIALASIPSTWVTGQIIDFVKGRGGQEFIAIDAVSTDITSNVVTFALTDIPDTLIAGDWLARSGESPLVQLPREFITILAQATAAHILESSGQPGADDARKKVDVMIERALKIIAPRIDGAPKFIRNSLWK